MKRLLCLFFIVQSWAVNAQNCDCRTNLDSLGFPWKLLFQKIFSKNPLNLEWIFYLKTVEL